MNNDPISRDALLELAHNHVGGTVDCNDIARFPAVDAVEVRHGRWIINKHYGDYECSECGKGNVTVMHFKNNGMHYCPNCGAKMDAGGERMSNETATLKDRQTALAFAYQILTDKRNANRYSMSQIRDMNTMESFDYFDMLRALRVIHAEVVEMQKEVTT